MKIKNLKYRCPEFYNIETTCHIHGWKNLTPFYWVARKKTLYFTIGINDVAVDILAKQNSQFIEIKLTSFDPLTPNHLDTLDSMIRRSLGLEISVNQLIEVASSIGKEYVDLIKNGAGRLLRSPTLWEDAAKTLFTTNCSWSLTKKICSSICSNEFASISPSGNFAFPEPKAFIGFESKELKQMIPIGYRSEYLILLAKAFNSNYFLEKIQSTTENAQKQINKLKGFGNYASNHLLLMMGKFDTIPIDSVVTTYLKKYHKVGEPASFIDRHYRKWGKYKWWGYKLETILARDNWLGD